MRVLKTITRILAFVGKELVEVVRRPGALLSLILGPFLIMAIFGVGYSGYRRPLTTVIVLPAKLRPADRCPVLLRDLGVGPGGRRGHDG